MPHSRVRAPIDGTALAMACLAARSRPWGCVAVNLGIAFALMLGLLTVAYETNDDALMSLIASGTAAAVAPDEHLVHSHVAIGLVLKALYDWLPNAAWYGWYLVLVQVAAQVGIAYCVLGDFYTHRRYILYLLYLAVVQTHLLTHLQFTSTAFLATLSGMLLLATCLYRKARSPEQSVWLPLSAAVLLSILGGLIRQNSAYLAMLLAVPAVLGILFASRFVRRLWLPAVAVYATAWLAVAGAWQLNNVYYESDPGWRGFYEYNALRVKFNDYEWFDYNADSENAFRSAGWNRTDFAMLIDSFYTDIDSFQHAQLERVASRLPQPVVRAGPRGWVRAVESMLAHKTVVPILVVAALAYWLTARSVWNRRIQLATWLLALAIVLGITTTTKMPPAHVFVPVLSSTLAVAVVLPEQIGASVGAGLLPIGSRTLVISLRLASEIRNYAVLRLPLAPLQAIACVAVLLAAVCVPWHVYQQYRRSRCALHRANRLEALAADLAAPPDQLIVAWRDAFPFEHMLPLRSPRPYRDLHMLSLGWSQRTPINENVLQMHRVKQLPCELYQRDDIRLISNPRLNDVWHEYARRRLDVETVFDVEDQTERFVIGRMRLRPVTPDGRCPAIRTAAPAEARTLR